MHILMTIFGDAAYGYGAGG